jgi:segregation and condensation protein B
MDGISLSAKIEALLFVAPGDVKISQLSTILGETETKIRSVLDKLEEDYTERGIRIQRHRNRIKLVSAPEVAVEIQAFLGLEETYRVSQAALETMAIIAYKQPVTRPEVDAIRGVNSDSVLKTLLHKGLIQEIGRSPGPGRPILYNITPEFLGHFGLTSLNELPPLEINKEVEELHTSAQ